jgi:predicted transposase/invertase (TIGR01784 family)
MKEKARSCGKIKGDRTTTKKSQTRNKRGKKMGRFLVSFDWAIKRLLRTKANFPVIEGLLTVLLQEKVTILEVIESESNKDRADDKYNRVDIAVKDSKGNIIIVEIQSIRDKYFMKRLAYGTSKVITERMAMGDKYGKVSKVISVAILFHNAGTDGADCIYGSNEFINLRTGEKIELTEEQKKHYNVESLTEVFPEYYLLVVENFNDVAISNLNEWLYFLKNQKIKDSFTAPGLKEAKEILDSSRLSDDEYRAYESYLDYNRRKAGIDEASFDDAVEKGRRERDIEIAREMKRKGMDVKTIADCTGLSVKEIEALRDSKA